MNHYDGYNYERFRELAKNNSLSMYEKIGFPNSYRADTERLIFEDILSKVPKLLKGRCLNVLDIGPGCSNLQGYISSVCRENEHTLFLADCPEMLALIKDESYVKKYAGFFPDDTFEAVRTESQGIDVIICYSVFQYIFVESNMWHFLDCILDLMNIGAETLIGDIPNISKRKRFFSSETGVHFHQKFMKSRDVPRVLFNRPEPGKIDDSLLLSMVMRCQYFGFDAYIVPQHKGLPFANRRDDLLIRRV